MATELVRHELYDETGLIKVEFIEREVPDIEQEIADKEQQLLDMYAELLTLREKQDNVS